MFQSRYTENRKTKENGIRNMFEFIFDILP